MNAPGFVCCQSRLVFCSFNQVPYCAAAAFQSWNWCWGSLNIRWLQWPRKWKSRHYIGCFVRTRYTARARHGPERSRGIPFLTLALTALRVIGSAISHSRAVGELAEAWRKTGCLFQFLWGTFDSRKLIWEAVDLDKKHSLFSFLYSASSRREIKIVNAFSNLVKTALNIFRESWSFTLYISA